MSILKANSKFQFKTAAANQIATLDQTGLFQTKKTYFELEEFFKQKPALNAVIGLPGSDTTSPTAAALAAYTIANKDFEVLGTNMTTALATLSAGGGITLTTAGASADSSIVLPHLDTAQTAWAVANQWGSGKSPRFEAWIATAASITDVTIWAGFKKTNTPVVATDDDQVFFRYQDTLNSARWQIISSRANVDTTTNLTADNTPDVAVSTLYRLVLEVRSDRTVMASINGNEVISEPLAVLTNTIDFIPYIGVLSGTSAAKAMDVKYLRCSKLAA